MPKIPRWQDRSPFTGVPVDPHAAAAPYAALAVAGRQVEQTGEMAFRAATYMEGKEKAAQDALQAAQLERQMREEFGNAAEAFRTDMDYKDYDSKMEASIDTIKNYLAPKDASPELQAAFEDAFSKMSFHFTTSIKARKYDVMNELGQIEFDNIYDQAAEDLAGEPDPAKRAIIKNELFIRGEKLKADYVLGPKWVDDKLRTFDKYAEAKGEMLEAARVREDIIRHPWETRALLEDPTYAPHLDPLTRVQLMEHAEVQGRMRDGQTDKAINVMQEDNASDAIDLYTTGRLTIAKLQDMRKTDPVIGGRGLSDSVYYNLWDKMGKGGSAKTDSATFNRLFLKPDLSYADIEPNLGKLDEGDTKLLLNVVRQTRREDEADARRQLAADVSLTSQLVGIDKSKADETKKIEKERRNRWASDAKSSLKKAMNSLTGFDVLTVEEGADVLRTFEGYVEDTKIAPEDLPEKAMQLIESKKGVALKWLKSIFMPDRMTKRDWEDEAEGGEGTGAVVESPLPAGPPTGTRKSLDEIFKGKAPAAAPSEIVPSHGVQSPSSSAVPGEQWFTKDELDILKTTTGMEDLAWVTSQEIANRVKGAIKIHKAKK